jgi:signal transduction histidine kinase
VGVAGTTWEQRTRPLVTVVPSLLLAFLAAVTVVLKRDEALVDLVLCAVVALWTVAFFPRRPAILLTGLILLGLVLASRDPWWGFWTPALYFYAFRIVGWPRELYFITGVAVVAGTAQATGVDYGTWEGLLTYAAVLAANIVPMCLLAWILDISARALRETREANERLAAALAENAALQERLVEQARAAGVLDERARLAREIHDTLAQGLTGIVTQLQAAEHAAGDPAGWRRHHAAATALARESLTEARRSVHELRPEPLETGRLADAVTQVAATWSARHHIPVRVAVTGEPLVLRPDAEVALLRVAQEALANVGKHASGATRVGLTLSYLEDQVALDVRDDGPGFVAEPGNGTAAGTVRPASGGFGLVAMRQRIEALAGSLQVESEVGVGTGISARVPVEAQEARP